MASTDRAGAGDPLFDYAALVHQAKFRDQAETVTIPTGVAFDALREFKAVRRRNAKLRWLHRRQRGHIERQGQHIDALKAAGSGRVDDVPTPTPSEDVQPEGCSHTATWESEPITAQNQNPEVRCSSCGAVMIPGTTSLARAIGPDSTG